MTMQYLDFYGQNSFHDSRGQSYDCCIYSLNILVVVAKSVFQSSKKMF
jgi:hypothetical protein